jgi:aspartate/methionine/tyrosine aminotransferase
VDQVVPTSGSKEAIFHFVQLLEPGSRIGFPVPGYPVYEGAACLGGHEPVPIKLKPESGFALEMEDYNGPPLNALWVCSPHNPTGTVLDLPRMRSLLEWCQSQGVLLLSDECYIDSFDPGSLRPLSFLELTQKDNWAGVVSFFTLSKRSGMTGYRSGFVAGDRRYIDAFKKYRPHAGLASPAFVQEAAATAWADDAHVQQRASVYAAKRQVVISFLDDLGWERVKSDSTFYVWARLPKGYPVARSYLERLARTTGIVATPGDCFGASEEARDWFRIALVPPLDVLDGALERWRLFESKGD